MSPKYKCLLILFFTLSIEMTIPSCKKLIEIKPPATTITTAEVFSDSTDALAAIVGIYKSLIYFNGSTGFGNYMESVVGGLSSDEYIYFNGNPSFDQYQQNLLTADNGILLPFFWNQPYYYIYQANASIEGLEASATISQSAKNQLISEAKFLRAFVYFYLVNNFGDVPYVASSAWQKTENTPRTAKLQVYQQIIADLKYSQNILPADFSVGNGERIRANKWTATALLARVYLYTKSYDSAETQASLLINNTSTFNLVTNPDSVFLANSSESILQLQQDITKYPYNATQEGFRLIPFSSTQNPSIILTEQLLNAFEPGDRRRRAWVDSTYYAGIFYYYPFKYKTGPAQQSPGILASEYYMVLRLAEQYLIRAEARAQQHNLLEAISDLNAIRERAGLPKLSQSLSPDQVLAAVAQERRIELFGEWAHRWFDLKRTGQANSVLGALKLGWKPTAQLYPIPKYELSKDHNLVQNPGY